MEAAKPKIYYVMGVSASGKTTLGKALAATLGLEFFDGDNYHLPENIAKMSAGQPLTDDDRKGWLKKLNALAQEHRQTGAVIGCSALKERYREWLSEGLGKNVTWIVLTGTFDQIRERIENRKGHFMPPALLRSQFDTLEIPAYGIHLPVTLTVAEMLQQIRTARGGSPPGVSR